MRELAIGCGMAEDLREIRQAKQIGLAHDDGAIDRVLELADVAGPVELREMGHGLSADAGDGAVFLGGKARQEMPQQMRDVFAPQPQRRNRQRQHVQPVEQVLAERTALHEVEQFAVGRGNDADVDLHRLAAADRLDGAFLQRAQELYLRRQRQLADLVEKQRAAGSFDELAHVAFGGAGEGALLVTEQDRFHEIVGDSAAIDRDERF